MSPERKSIDTEAIKRSVKLVEIARRYTRLHAISQRGEGEFAGPCPLCGGEDRFHVRGEHFYCRQCTPRGGDVIDLVRLVHGVSFVEACTLLTSREFSFSERPPLTLRPAETTAAATMATWRAEAYQESARQTMAATQRRLFGDVGESGRAYLGSRGLTEETWRTYQLGFGRTFHPGQRENQDAIFLPWFAPDLQTITAIQHRFLGPGLGHGERYCLKPGSEPILFGLQALRIPLAAAETLFVVEGEFNCMSLQQSGLQALSVGSAANVGNAQRFALLNEMLMSFERVILWFDDAAAGRALAQRLETQGPFRKEKILSVAPRWDANRLLVAGELSGFVATL